MAGIAITERDLRAAMRDRRYWQAGHPEREAYVAWVGEGWRELAAAGRQGAGGDCVQVSVRPYERTRHGRREQVDGYTQCRPTTGRRADDIQVAQARRERGRTTEDAALSPSPPPQPRPQPVVVFVGGFLDGESNIVRQYASEFGLLHRDRRTQYFSHDEGAGIRRFIESLPNGTSVSLVGHSWGGNAAAEVAAALGAAGRPVDTLVTIDPVGLGTSEAFFARVRAGAGRWINVNAVGDGTPDFSDVVAFLGRPYGAGPRSYAHSFVDAPVPHGQFRSMMDKFRDAAGRSALDAVLGQ